MKRLFFWIKRCMHNDRDCHQFCPTCRFFKICRLDENIKRKEV